MRDTVGYTGILADQMSWVQNVVLPYEISRAEFRTARISTPSQLYPFSIQVNDDLGVLDESSTILAHKVFMPPDQLCEIAGGLGFRLSSYDEDRKVRWQPLAMYYEGYYYPSVELMTAAEYLGVGPEMITVHGGEKVTIGSHEIPTNERTEMYINFNRPGESFRRISAGEVLSETVNFAAFTDKLVIVSLTAERYADVCRTPVSDMMWSSVKSANVIENIIHDNFIRRYDSSPGIDNADPVRAGRHFRLYSAPGFIDISPDHTHGKHIHSGKPDLRPVQFIQYTHTIPIHRIGVNATSFWPVRSLTMNSWRGFPTARQSSPKTCACPK